MSHLWVGTICSSGIGSIRIADHGYSTGWLYGLFYPFYYGERKMNIMQYTATTVSATPPCKHHNGWYNEIPARWFGHITVFVCIDCGAILKKNKKTSKYDVAV